MNENILLLNCGSSSIKYQLIDPKNPVPLASGLVQRIGQSVSTIDHKVDGEEFSASDPYEDHKEAVEAVVHMFQEHGPSLEKVTAVGHRTVHGGSEFIEPTLIDDAVVEKMRSLIPLAPLHNPPAIAGIEGAKKVLPDVPHVAVFDTAFFSDLPEEAYTYPIDREVAKKYGIRRYGFHGTSHEYVSHQAAKFLGTPIEELKLIVAHIGNGASMSAIDGGRPIDTSMGLTPLEGLMMGTRSGDIDPGLHTYLLHQGMNMEEVDVLLNKKSGLQGMIGMTDMRDVTAAALEGNEDAILAQKVYTRRIVKYIGAYAALLGGLDAVIFTAGVGENAARIRKLVVDQLAGLGFKLDDEANEAPSRDAREISAADSPVKVLVIPTNEELAMARHISDVVAISGCVLRNN